MKRFSTTLSWPMFSILTLAVLLISCSGNDMQSNDSTATASNAVSASTGEGGAGIGGQVPGQGGKGVVPFSGDKEKIKKKMAMITGATVRLDTLSNSEGALSYKGGAFGGFPVDDWTFLFHGGQMMLAQLNYNDQNAGATADSMYTRMTELMERQYGVPLINSKNRISRPLSAYTEPTQQFIAKVGKSLYGEYQLWTTGEDAAYLITVNKVQWNTAGGPTFVHVAFYNRELSESYFAATEGNSEGK